MRVDKFLSNAGIASRSQLKKYLKDKRISINDVLIMHGKTQIDPSKDIVKVDNKIIEYKQYYYFVLNKPKGYVSANEDDKYPTVMDFFSHLKIKGLSHVGRLDIDTTGVLLITNDGKLGHFLISPKSNVKKIYNVTVNKPLTKDLISKFKKGIVLNNEEICKPSKLEIIDSTHCNLTLSEGKYHQVKRMMHSVGYEVTSLNRELFAFLTVKNLKLGEYYELSNDEVEQLKTFMR